MTNHPFPDFRERAKTLADIVDMCRQSLPIAAPKALHDAAARLRDATRFSAEDFATGQRNGRAYDAERVADAMSRNLFAAADNVESAANAEESMVLKTLFSGIEGEIRAAATDVLLAAGLIEE